MTHVIRCDGCSVEHKGTRTPPGWRIALDPKREHQMHLCRACRGLPEVQKRVYRKRPTKRKESDDEQGGLW